MPPTEDSAGVLAEFEQNKKFNNIYFYGWYFRNPKGIKKYRSEIISAFKPRKEIWEKVESANNNLRKKYKQVIGVHIRKGDYEKFGHGKFYFTDSEAEKIVREYCLNFNLDKDSTCLLICSNGKVDTELFNEYNIYVHKDNDPVIDLFLLSKCDYIIGSDSTFGNFAAYFGDIPYIVFQRPQMDWIYYKNKNIYFTNKYSRAASKAVS